jgi:hypothetical protein
LLSPAVFTILIVSTLGVQADDATHRQSTLPSAKAERLVLSPGNLRFGKVAIGQRNSRTVTISNRGPSSVTFVQAITKGMGFTLSGLDFPLTLAGGESFTFSGVFAPRSRGDASGSISFVSDTSSIAKPALTLELAGTGTNSSQLTVDPVLMDFGNASVGSSASRSGSLTTPDGAVTVASAQISTSDFVLSGLSFPFTIPAGGSQAYSVLFVPQTEGALSATLSFFADDGSAITVQPLAGISAATSQDHWVDLSWNASISLDVIGYNVYRGNTSGGPYSKINPELDPSTSYADISVKNGSTYYYVATAVNSSDQESVPSDEVMVVIPDEDREIAASTRGSGVSRRIAMNGSPLRKH